MPSAGIFLKLIHDVLITYIMLYHRNKMSLSPGSVMNQINMILYFEDTEAHPNTRDLGSQASSNLYRDSLGGGFHRGWVGGGQAGCSAGHCGRQKSHDDLERLAGAAANT